MVAPMSRAPALMIGARLAGEPGRGRRAVPVRSALVGAIAGMIGSSGASRSAPGSRTRSPTPPFGRRVELRARRGGGLLPAKTIDAVARDRDIRGAIGATWERAVPVDGHPTPMFGTSTVQVPCRSSCCTVGDPRPRRDRVRTHHDARAPPVARRPGARRGRRRPTGHGRGRGAAPGDVAHRLRPERMDDRPRAAGRRSDARRSGSRTTCSSVGGRAWTSRRRRGGSCTSAAPICSRSPRCSRPRSPTCPHRGPPARLGGFFALLGCATVAHALVTTVRRRRHDLAVLRSIGFTRRQTRGAIAWQATLIAAVGICRRAPRHRGRTPHVAMARRRLPDRLRTAVRAARRVLVAAVAIVLANALAAGPAHVASRIRPAEALRVE